MKKKTFYLSAKDTVPEPEAVLAAQGVPEISEISDLIRQKLDKALELYTCLCSPAAIVTGITVKEFSIVLKGEGNNSEKHPLSGMVPKSTDLALFAVTAGKELSSRIEGLFRADDYSLASMLDACASVGAEKIADLLQNEWTSYLNKTERLNPDIEVLRYSPGYCGWDVTGQIKLFSFLKPEKIGISLTQSCLMEPVKSISGVLVAGPREIHAFRNNFDFCNQCNHKSCRQRIKSISSSG